MPADPNADATDPNAMLFNPMLQYPDPNMSLQPPLNLTPGKLATNWLFQGKKPPQPLVGQENVTFRIERYPWPYTGYFGKHSYWDQDYYAGPWFYAPWYRHDYWRYYSNNYWRHCRDYHDGWWYNDAYTYPLNYVQMKIKLNENTSFNLGVSFTSDPVPWP